MGQSWQSGNGSGTYLRRGWIAAFSFNIWHSIFAGTLTDESFRATLPTVSFMIAFVGAKNNTVNPALCAARIAEVVNPARTGLETAYEPLPNNLPTAL